MLLAEQMPANPGPPGNLNSLTRAATGWAARNKATALPALVQAGTFFIVSVRFLFSVINPYGFLLWRLPVSREPPLEW